MDIENALNNAFGKYRSRNQDVARSSICGFYDIDYVFVLIHENYVDVLEADYWTHQDSYGSANYYLREIVNGINDPDSPFITKDPLYSNLHGVVIFRDVDDKHVELDFWVVEGSEHDAVDIASIRKVFKRNFEKYRIKEHKVKEPGGYFSEYYYSAEKSLTRRKLTVKVTKQELTYHMLIGKFVKKALA